MLAVLLAVPAVAYAADKFSYLMVTLATSQESTTYADLGHVATWRDAHPERSDRYQRMSALLSMVRRGNNHFNADAAAT